MSDGKNPGYGLTPFNIEEDKAWAEMTNKLIEEAHLKGVIMSAFIPGYGTFGDQKAETMNEIRIRMERVARFNNAEAELLRVELLTRELNGTIG